jgi:acetyl-CoA carboxylase carboxyl transferase subunit beta
VAVPNRSGWEQVQLSRTVDRPSGAELLAALLDDGDDEAVPLRGGDDSVVAKIGRIGGHRAVVIAMSSRRAGRVDPAGFHLVTRAARLAGRLDLACVILVDTAGADPLPVSEQAGVAPAIAAAMHAVLHARGPTLSVVHGEGGSGGALAGAVTDVVGVTDSGWFAALGPEGAAAALRTTAERAADLMGVTPRDLLASGFADALAPSDAAPLRQWLAARLDGLRSIDPGQRLARRHERWAGPLPGSSQSGPPDDPEIA